MCNNKCCCPHFGCIVLFLIVPCLRVPQFPTLLPHLPATKKSTFSGFCHPARLHFLLLIAGLGVERRKERRRRRKNTRLRTPPTLGVVEFFPPRSVWLFVTLPHFVLPQGWPHALLPHCVGRLRSVTNVATFHTTVTFYRLCMVPFSVLPLVYYRQRRSPLRFPTRL